MGVGTAFVLLLQLKRMRGPSPLTPVPPAVHVAPHAPSPQASVTELKDRLAAAVQALRDVAAWHCEQVTGANWEFSNCKPFFEALHK